MVGLIIEFSLIVAWFAWMRRRELRERERAQRVRPEQMHLELDEED
jgi:hypothetical protein